MQGIKEIHLKERTVDRRVDKPGKEMEITVTVRRFYKTYQSAGYIPIYSTWQLWSLEAVSSRQMHLLPTFKMSCTTQWPYYLDRLAKQGWDIGSWGFSSTWRRWLMQGRAKEVPPPTKNLIMKIQTSQLCRRLQKGRGKKPTHLPNCLLQDQIFYCPHLLDDSHVLLKPHPISYFELFSCWMVTILYM